MILNNTLGSFHFRMDPDGSVFFPASVSANLQHHLSLGVCSKACLRVAPAAVFLRAPPPRVPWPPSIRLVLPQKSLFFFFLDAFPLIFFFFLTKLRIITASLKILHDLALSLSVM